MNNKENDFGFVRVRLEKDGFMPRSEKPINNVNDAVDFIVDELHDLDRETVVILMLNTAGKPLCANIVSVGSLNESMVHPREIMKSAVLSNSSGIIMMHNHPSGQILPSKEDKEVTKRLQAAGAIMGIQLVDSIIFSPTKQKLSMREQEYFYDITSFDDAIKKMEQSGKKTPSTEYIFERKEATGMFIERTIEKTEYKIELKESEVQPIIENTKTFEKMSYEEKFKTILEFELPEVKGNDKLQDALYNTYINSEHTSLFGNELKEELLETIERYPVNENKAQFAKTKNEEIEL